MIRRSFTTSDQTLVRQAIEFAQNNLAPYAPLDVQYKNDLERAMALLIIPQDSWNKVSSLTTSGPSSSTQNHFGSLAELVDPSLRREVAKNVNEAILKSQEQRWQANIRYLVRARAWAEQLARDKKVDLPESLRLGLDSDGPADGSQNGHSGEGDTEMTENDGDDDDDSADNGGEPQSRLRTSTQ
jgi:hypothetical protein